MTENLRPTPDTRKRRTRLVLLLLSAAALWLLLAIVSPAISSGATDTGEEVDAVSALPPATEPPDRQLPDPYRGAAEIGAPQPLPACAYGGEPAPMSGLNQWQYTLLDTTFRLSPEYVPPDLVDLQTALAHLAPRAELAGGGHQLRGFAAAALAALFEAAEAAGMQLAVQSAYRSYTYQQATFDYWVQQEGLDAALRTSARAGHSEHQLGTAVDLRSRHGPAAWDLDDWATTPEGAWTQANAHRFGFVMSYPAGAEGVSCYSYEPWHYRYVGPALAATIHESGLAPRQFLWSALQTMQHRNASTEESDL